MGQGRTNNSRNSGGVCIHVLWKFFINMSYTTTEEWDEETPNPKKEALREIENETWDKVLNIVNDDTMIIWDKLLSIHELVEHSKETYETIEHE